METALVAEADGVDAFSPELPQRPPSHLLVVLAPAAAPATGRTSDRARPPPRSFASRLQGLDRRAPDGTTSDSAPLA